MTKDEILQLKPGTLLGTGFDDDDDLIFLELYENGIVADDGYFRARKLVFETLTNDKIITTIFVGEFN